MKNFLFLYIAILALQGCKTGSDSNRHYDSYDPNKIYHLQLNPVTGSSYHYSINNNTELNIEVDDKKMENEKRTNVEINYHFQKDSSGNFLMTMIYDSIHLYTNSNGTETDFDAINAANAYDPVEKMLGVLKSAKVLSTVTPSGEILSLSGYKEIGDSLIAKMGNIDLATKNVVLNQWEKKIGEGFVKKNLAQLFKIFPDSAVHLGDTWQLASKEEAELSMVIKSSYKLKAINSEVALIQATANIASENAPINSDGLGDVTANIRGTQEGQYEMETKTGLLLNCTIITDVRGTIQVRGRDVPLKIKSTVTIKGKKI